MKLIDILVQELPKRGGWPDGCHAITQDSDKAINEYSSLDGVEINEHGTWRAVKSWNDYCVRAAEAPCLAEDYHAAIITRDQYEAALAEKNDGWIEWGGGECPVERGTMVDVRYRNGCECHHVGAGLGTDTTGSDPDHCANDWYADGTDWDIISYRLHKPQEVTDDETDLNECIGQDVAPVWSGEGLPPVGCECEYQYKVHGSEWHPLECVAVDGKAVFGWSNNTPVALQSNTHNFRPIRSEADKKREEAKHTIAELCRSAASNGHAADLIYDAIAAGKIPGVKLED